MANPKTDATDAISSGIDVAKTQQTESPLPKRESLPKGLQRIMDTDDDSVYDDIYDGVAGESTDSNIRYAAYATRIRTALLSAQRYVAYTSDIGESFRPVAHPNWVRAAYGISWAYLAGDVAHEGYKAYCSNQLVKYPTLPRVASATHYNDASSQTGSIVDPNTTPLLPGKVAPLDDYRTVMVQRAIFQSIASMGLPAFTIHSIVKYSGKALKDSKNVRLRTYGPIGLGLAAVPALPFMFDHPVETAVEWTFHKGFQLFGGQVGQDMTGDAPPTGREKILHHERKEHKKEL